MKVLPRALALGFRSCTIRSSRHTFPVFSESRPRYIAGYAMAAAEHNGDGKIDAMTNGTDDGMRFAKGTEWETPGPAAFDFRSDTTTRPTASMLAAVVHTTLGDDVEQEDRTTRQLEAWMADLLPTHSENDGTSGTCGLLVLSGTMGNQVAQRTHLGSPPHSVVADHRAHILEHEAGAMSMIAQAFPLAVVPANGAYLTLADVQRRAVLDDNIHHAPTRLVSLENTLGGAVMPLADVLAITQWARAHGIATHLDGARLWDAAAALCARDDGAVDAGDLRRTLRAYTSCFDSVTVCFSKGLGAPMGSVLVGNERFIKKARHVRKMLGGGTRMSGLFAAPAAAAVRDTFFGGKLARAHLLARKLERGWTALGGRVAGDTADGKTVRADAENAGTGSVLCTNMVWLDTKASGVPEGLMAQEAKKEGLNGFWHDEVLRVVCHYQIADEAVDRLLKVFERVLAQRQAVDAQPTASIGTGFHYGEAAQ